MCGWSCTTGCREQQAMPRKTDMAQCHSHVALRAPASWKLKRGSFQKPQTGRPERSHRRLEINEFCGSLVRNSGYRASTMYFKTSGRRFRCSHHKEIVNQVRHVPIPWFDWLHGIRLYQSIMWYLLDTYNFMCQVKKVWGTFKKSYCS